MSTYWNKCGVNGFLQGRVAGDLVETRLTEACSIVCYNSAHPTHLETLCVLLDVSQIWVVLNISLIRPIFWNVVARPGLWHDPLTRSQWPRTDSGLVYWQYSNHGSTKTRGWRQKMALIKNWHIRVFPADFERHWSDPHHSCYILRHHLCYVVNFAFDIFFEFNISGTSFTWHLSSVCVSLFCKRERYEDLVL